RRLLREPEEQGTGGVGRDQRADVRAARGDNAVERRRDDLEGLQLGEAAGLGFRGLHAGGTRGGGGGFFLHLRRRRGFLLGRVLPAARRRFRGGGVGAGQGKRGLGLVKLLVDLGGIDDRERLARLAPVADVNEPLGKVAGSARVNE